MKRIVKINSAKDVNPQFLRMSVVAATVNVFEESEVSTPNIAEAGFVMEILKIFMEWEPVTPTGLAVGDTFRTAVYDRSRAALPNISDPGVLAKMHQTLSLVTSGAAMPNYWCCFDLTDGAGNGVLYGKKNIYLAIENISQAAVGRADVAILYRLKRVTVTELVGLIQE